VGCLADMPYGYFQLVRFLGMIGFVLLAFQEKEKGNEGYFWIWLGSAILINPTFKISLGRELWNVIDIIWTIFLLFSLNRKINCLTKYEEIDFFFNYYLFFNFLWFRYRALKG
jgi:hypothetical protein